MMKKEIGQVFTPEEIVRYILDNSFFTINYLSSKSSQELINLRIADISVGEGIFLLEAYKRLYSVLKERKDVHDIISKEGYSDIRKWIIEKNLYGIDIDSEALSTAKENLKKESGVESLNFNLIEGNALLNYTKDKNKEFIFNIRFDYLFGNPPYSKNIKSEEKKKYFYLYKESIGGHPNLCALFLHKSIDMLAKNGILGYLVAAPYINAYYHRNLRKMIADKTTIIEVLRFEDRKKVIDGILQELSIIIFSKQKPKQDYLLNVAVTNDLKSLVNKNIHKTQINFSKFYHNGDYAHEFLIAKSQIDYNIKDKMKSKGKPLSKFSAIHTGEVVQFRNKHQLTNISKEGSYPLIKIENVNSFKVSKKYDSWFKPKKGMQYTHSGGLILVKRLTSKEQPKRIIASFFKEKRFAVDNKLNLLKPYDSKDLISIMGLLNSKLIDYYFRLYISNTQFSSN